MLNCSLQFFQHSKNLVKMWSYEAKRNDFGQSVWIQELFLHKLSLADKNWKPLNLILRKWQFFFKSLSFLNQSGYWTLLGLEWKIFCHSLVIRFYFYIGYWSLAAKNMSRCPYIYELDGKNEKKKIKLSFNHSVGHLFSSYFCFIYLNTFQIQ